MRIQFYLLLIISVLLSSCDKREVRYEYHDVLKNNVKSEGQYLNGVLDGLLTYYSPDGKKQETSEWSNGVRHGLTIALYPNGKVGNEYLYRNGKACGLKIFYETGVLKYEAKIDSDNFFYNVKNFSEDGSILEIAPSIKFNKDTLSYGDTLKIVGSLNNIQDSINKNGFMVIGSEFTNNQNRFLKDTFAIASSDTNFYKILMVPKKKGEYQFVAQLAYRTQDSVDSLSFFWSKFNIVVE
ncbi:MAG: hypothetical protein BroJett042_27820 [Bacteroidota bacterium]|nr:MAG: hypothetical protein BroJett042_27820 [Bacteroidota bacterium]